MNNKIIISLISFIIVLALWFFAIVPLWLSIKIPKTSISELNQETVEIENLLAKGKQLEQKYLESQEQAQKVVLALPTEKDISYLLIQFEGLALQSGLLLEGINFNQVDDGEMATRQRDNQPSFLQTNPNEKLPEGVHSLLVDINVSGSYEALKNYLNSLENNVRSMDIYQIEIESFKEGKDDFFGELNIFEFILGVRVYYAK